MSLNRDQAKRHEKACQLPKKERLSFDERWFVIENFHEGGDCNNKHAGAHFTPIELANDLKLEIVGPRVLDLCAGIGVLAFAYFHCIDHGDRLPELVCVELNPRYVEVGKKVLPEAEWICGDVFDPVIRARLKTKGFDSTISNPPFGRHAMRGRQAPRYQGGLFEYAVIDIAGDLANYGVFIIPQNSSPFLFSGVQCFQDLRSSLPGDPLSGQAMDSLRKYRAFADTTGTSLEPGVGIDASIYRLDWRGVTPTVEIVTVDYTRSRIEAGLPAYHHFEHVPHEEGSQLSLELLA